MSIEAMKQALEALRFALHVGFDESSESQIKKGDKAVRQHQDAITALRTAIAEAESVEPVAWQVMVEDEAMKEFPIKDMAHDWCVKQKLSGSPYSYWIRPLYTTPPAAQRQPLIDSVRQMRDVQGIDGTWNCDPYMHGLYNGLEFAVSLLEQREPQFKDAPEKWLNDLPKPRIFSATEVRTA